LSDIKSALSVFYVPDRKKGARSVAFVRSSVRLSVCPSVAYIANNSRTQRPNVRKSGRKFPHLRCDSHILFKVGQRSGLQAGGGITCQPNPAATLIVKPQLATARLTRLHASMMSICLSVCLSVCRQNAKKRDFLKN